MTGTHMLSHAFCLLKVGKNQSEQGIVKTTEAEVYAETTRLRLNMASARLGWSGSWFSDLE